MMKIESNQRECVRVSVRKPVNVVLTPDKFGSKFSVANLIFSCSVLIAYIEHKILLETAIP